MSTIVLHFVWIGRFLPESPGLNATNDQAQRTPKAVRLSAKLGVTLGTAKRLFIIIRSCPPSFQSATVTRKKVAGMEVTSLRALLFWLSNRTSSSFCRSPARPFFSAASNAFMVGP